MGKEKFYIVRSKTIIREENDNLEFKEIEKVFKNSNSLIARGEAFRYYQNLLEVLLESKGLTYKSDKIARDEFEKFLEPEYIQNIRVESIDDLDPNMGMFIQTGIGVFIDCDSDSKDQSPYDNESDLLIHGIGDIGNNRAYESVLIGLEYEYE